jgi:hypothetical protein
MLDVYATEIALLLTDQRYPQAERQALAIPHIAIALSDAALQSSCSAYQAWCSRWVQPDFGTATYKEWCIRTGECTGDRPDVPFSGLRALRLRRRARELISPTISSEAFDSTTVHSVARALLGAQFRWFQHEGRYREVVQKNLARLGVLR